MLDPVVAELIGAVVRWLVTSISTYFVARHVLTADLSERFATYAGHTAVAWAPAAAALVWSVVLKWRRRGRAQGGV